MPSQTLAIADLLDYEAQLAQDALEPVQSLVQRDRAIGQKAPEQSDRRALISYWLDEMRVRNPRLPGRTWLQTNRFTMFACVVFGLMSGSGFMKTLLAYDGTRPVSVFPILGFFVFLQIFFLAFLALKTVAYALLRRGGVGFFPDLMLRWLRTNLRDVFRRENETTRTAREFFRRFHALHAPLEAAIAMKFLQTFVLSFHVAAFGTFLYTIAFSDLAFSWATTPRLSPQVFHDIVRIIATPFAWIDALVPDLGFVEATQYSRLEGRYVLAPTHSRLPANVDVGAWWPFLAACILTYAVFPRFFLIQWEKHVIHRYLRARTFDDHASTALLTRLTQPAGVWATPGTTSTAPRLHLEESAQRRAASIHADAPCVVVKWFGFPATDDVLKSFLEETFRLEVTAIVEGSGTDADFERIRTALASHSPNKTPRVVIAADPWEVPGEAAERLLQNLRSATFTHLTCLFAPLTFEDGHVRLASEQEVAIWRQSLRAYRDPYAGLIVDLGVSP